MKQRKLWYALATATVAALSGPVAQANICGTDYQNFNPTTNGLDFVTVQSSETLKPCVINTGLFMHYSADSLAYSKTLNASFPAGQKRKDRTLSSDLSVGVGITDRWDIGINVPIVLDQRVEDDYFAAAIGKNGATEVKGNTKFRLLGGDSGGLAAVFSVNKNLVADNPFVGRGAGLTYNYELAADTVIADSWAVAVNLGYRDRHPGNQVAGSPFIPLGDQWIYSVAGSYLVTSLDTKVIGEIYGSRSVKDATLDTERNQNALEALLGLKHDVNGNMAVHFGATHQIDSSLGGAEWRVYAGMNWAIGPVCRTPAAEPIVITEPVTVEAPRAPQIVVMKLDSEVLFEWDSDKLKPDALEMLQPQITALLAPGFERIQVEGHTDSLGHAAYNLDLSQRRANFMRKYLIDTFKLPETKVGATGYGPAHPTADNGNYQGRRRNRRVELKVTRKE